MGDPYWRRFNSAKEPERTALSSEYANVNTRPLSRGAVEDSGRSRNDLFSTDWKWKGKSAEGTEQEKDVRRGFTEGNILETSCADPQQETQNRAANQEARHPSDTAADLASQLSRDISSSTLGAPIQLEPSVLQTSLERRRPPSHVQTRRSRNDSIYNVNHLTITPPRPSSPVDASPRISLLADETRNRRTVSAQKRSTLQSPLSRHHTTTRTAESSTSSDSSADSAITSFTEQADQPGPSSMSQPRHSMTSPLTSPITPFTPVRHRFGHSPSSLTPNEIDVSVQPRATEKIPTAMAELQSPQTGMSLSRSSSLTMSRSPSTALTNVVRKSARLLVDSDDELEPRLDKAPVDGEPVRVRTEINSRQWLVGYGRYAKVFLGSYRTASTGWNLCAAKVFEDDADSAEMARKEASVLCYLHDEEPGPLASLPIDGRPFILDCLALIDETLIDCPPESSIYDLSQPCSAANTPTRSNTQIASGSAMARTSTEGCSTPGGNVRAVYTSSAGQCRTSETTSILRQLVRSAELKPLSDNPVHRPILLLPFCANGSMATFLKTQADGIDIGLWSTWFRQGLAALAWCKRKGVLHNDIKVSSLDNVQDLADFCSKPANFLLDDNLNLKLGDFGSALRINEQNPPSDGIGLGTVPYSSPEIVDPSPDRTFSFPSDTFSFGVTMRQCMTGREPYEGLRAVETMYHVRKGNFWEFQARQAMAVGGSLPVALLQSEGIRRAESLRQPLRKCQHRPSLTRTPSSDILLRRTDETIPDPNTAASGQSPVLTEDESVKETQDLERARESWLQRMVDPDPAKRPTAEELLVAVIACAGEAGQLRQDPSGVQGLEDE